jgi:hypothetical protein
MHVPGCALSSVLRLQIWQGIVSVAVIRLADYWPVVWAVTGAASVVVLGGPAFWECYKRRKGKHGAGAGRKVTARWESLPAAPVDDAPMLPSMRLHVNTGRQPVDAV